MKISDNYNSSVQSYWKEVNKYPVLSEEENLNLIREYLATKNPVLRNKLVCHNLRLVAKIATQIKTIPANYLDLIQEGNIGLTVGIEKFDESKKVPVANYLALWIRAYMKRFLTKNIRLIKLSNDVQKKVFWNLSKVRARLEAQGISATPELIAAELNVKVSDVIYMINFMNQESSIFDDEGKPYPLEDSGEIPSAACERQEFNSKLKSLLDSFMKDLKLKKREVFKMRFLQDEEMTFQEIADKIYQQGYSKKPVTRQRVQQIEAEVIDDFKHYLKSHPL